MEDNDKICSKCEWYSGGRVTRYDAHSRYHNSGMGSVDHLSRDEQEKGIDTKLYMLEQEARRDRSGYCRNKTWGHIPPNYAGTNWRGSTRMTESGSIGRVGYGQRACPAFAEREDNWSKY